MGKAAWIVLLAVATAAVADSRKLAVTADVGICAHRSEVHLNTGGQSRIRIKGNEHYYLFGFDTKAVATWKITGATLHLKLARGHLRRVAACTVPAAWTEGTAAGKPQAGSTCYTHLTYPDRRWTPDGGTMLDATFNSPHMMWRAAKVTTEGGWLKIPIAPELVQAVAAGLSHGLVLGEEAGQTRENHDVYTREQSNARPYLVVQGRPHHVAIGLKRPPAKAMAFPPAADLRTGAIAVDTRWPGKTVLGSRVTLHRPIGTMGMTTGEQVTFGDPVVVFGGARLVKEGTWRKWQVRVQTFIGPQAYTADLGPIGPSPPAVAPSPPKLAPSAELHLSASGPWRLGLLPPTAVVGPGAAGRAAGGTIPAPVTARNAWVGLQAVLLPPAGKADNVTVSLGRLEYAGDTVEESIPPLAHVRLSRVWAVQTDKGPHGEVLVPLPAAGGFSIPWARNKLTTQTHQPIFVDIWVPKTTLPGPYAGTLTVKQAGRTVASAATRLTVGAATLPDRFHIAGDMNTYSSPAGAMGVNSSNAAATMAAERKYYRLAHAHRMTLSVLPYSQSGSIHWRGAPVVAGRGAACKVTDWRAWDQRYGPLLSGQAFSPAAGYVGPGTGVPIRHMYLPLHENWPAPLAGNFTPWPPPRDYQKFLRYAGDLPPIEQCFSKAYADAWTAVLRQFAAHLRQKQWTRTRYQVYLNNKYYFRKDSGRGTSLWLLDEPMFADDFLALRYFGRLTRAAAGPAPAVAGGVAIDYRIDISRPTHQRQWLDGLVGLNVCADQLYSQRRLIAYRKRQFGERYWNYRMPPSFTGSNVGWAAWPIRSYCWGAAGTLPWQTIASDGDLQKADPTALMYPGRKFGLDGPVPSIRMKAWRDGLQTAELLRMLRVRGRWSDVQLRAWVGQVCGLDGWRDGADPAADAPIVTFAGITPAKLQRLHDAAIEALAGK